MASQNITREVISKFKTLSIEELREELPPWLSPLAECDELELGTATPFSYCKGLLTLSVPLQVVNKIKEHCSSINNGVVGLLFGNVIGTNIQVEESLTVDLNTCGKLIDVIKKFCKKDSVRWVGFFSKGQFPNEEDINVIQEIIRFTDSSSFLLKFSQSNEDDLLDCFECVYDNNKHNFNTHATSERILIMQAYTTPGCSRPFSQPEAVNGNTQGTPTIFYIGVEACLFDRTERLARLHLTDRQKLEMIDYVFTMSEINDKYHMILCETAKIDGLALKEKSLRDYQCGIKELEFDCVKYLKDLCRKCGLEVTYYFEVPLNCFDKDQVECTIRILNYYCVIFGAPMKGNDIMKESALQSTCEILLSFIEKIKPPRAYIDLDLD